eukprot:2193771-Pyramimonas_sp.AAC.1
MTLDFRTEALDAYSCLFRPAPSLQPAGPVSPREAPRGGRVDRRFVGPPDLYPQTCSRRSRPKCDAKC